MAATKVVVINTKTSLAHPSTKLILQRETIYAKETCSSPCFCAGRFLFGFCRKKIKMKLKNNAKQVARQSIALSPYNRNVISEEG